MPTVDGLAGRTGDALVWKASQLAASKGMFLIRTLILARLLSPDEFGLLAIATVAVGFLVSVTELGMNQALVHQQQVDEGHYNTAWTVNLMRGLAVAGALLVASPQVAAFFGEPRAADVLRFLALKPLLDASASIKVAELVRDLRYRSLALINLPAVGVETAVSIALAMRLGVWALVAGSLAGAVVALVMSYVVAPHRPRPVLDTNTARPLVRYGRWVFLTGLVVVAAGSLTQWVIARRLGAAELGLYFLAAKLAFLPHELARQVIGEVAFSLYPRIQTERARVGAAFRAFFLGTAALVVPVYALLIAAAPWLVSDVLGARWSGTEHLIQLLGAVGIIGLFGDTTRPLFRGLGHPNWVLGIEMWQSSLVVALLWSLTGQYGVLGAPIAWLIAVGTSQAVSLILVRRLLLQPFAGATQPLVLIIAASLSGAATIVMLHGVVSGVGGLMVAAALAAVVTATIMWLCDAALAIGLRSDLMQAFPRVAGFITERRVVSAVIR